MYGAILGDIAGSRFEFDRGGRTRKRIGEDMRVIMDRLYERVRLIAGD